MKENAASEGKKVTNVEVVSEDTKSTKKKSKKKNSDPGWLNLDRYDFFCSIYCIWFLFSGVIFLGGSSRLEEYLGIDANFKKFLWIYGSGLSLVFITQTVLGFKGIGKSVLRISLWPGFLFYYCSSFLLQFRKTSLRIRKNIPIRLTYLFLTPILYVLGGYATDHDVINFVWWILASHMIIALLWGVRWSLNPFDFLRHAQFLKNHKVKSKFILNLVKLDSKHKEVTVGSLVEKAEMLKKFVNAYDIVVKKLASNKSLFVCFLFVLFSVSVHIVLGGTVLLRMGHLLAGTEGLIVVNNFFSGTISDFFYITINTFLPSELYGIEFVGKDFRWILTGFTVSSYSLLVIAIAGFSMAGSSKVEETVSELTKDMHTVIDEATEIIKEGDSEKLIAKNEKKDKETKDSEPDKKIPLNKTVESEPETAVLQ